MSFPAILAISVALAMDAFAVALTSGIRLHSVSLAKTLHMAGTFGFCQFAMPVAGWLLGTSAQKYIEAYDHWIAFTLLFVIGGKMLWESWKNRGKSADECEYADPTSSGNILMMGIATSIDALAVGISLALLNVPALYPAVVIGIVCFLLSAAGLHLGRLVCRYAGTGSIGNKANALGGLVLVGIGLSILTEHGVFG